MQNERKSKRVFVSTVGALVSTDSRPTTAFSCGARTAFNLKEQRYLRNMLSRRQLQGFVGRRSSLAAEMDIKFVLNFVTDSKSPLAICGSSRIVVISHCMARSIFHFQDKLFAVGIRQVAFIQGKVNG
jgi:hypothetical protein